MVVQAEGKVVVDEVLARHLDLMKGLPFWAIACKLCHTVDRKMVRWSLIGSLPDTCTCHRDKSLLLSCKV